MSACTRGYIDTAGSGLCGRGTLRAAAALAHSLNANMLRKRVIDAPRQARPITSASSAAAWQPSLCAAGAVLSSASAHREIQIELHRNGAVLKVSWQAAAARDCAAWLSDCFDAPGGRRLADHRINEHACEYRQRSDAHCRGVRLPPAKSRLLRRLACVACLLTAKGVRHGLECYVRTL